MQNEVRNHQSHVTKYDRIAEMDEFRVLMAEKKKFILSYTLFYVGYSLLLPFLALYTDVLNVHVFGEVTLAWLYGVSFIPVSLWVCNVYVKRAAHFDEVVKSILERENV